MDGGASVGRVNNLAICSEVQWASRTPYIKLKAWQIRSHQNMTMSMSTPPPNIRRRNFQNRSQPSIPRPKVHHSQSKPHSSFLYYRISNLVEGKVLYRMGAIYATVR